MFYDVLWSINSEIWAIGPIDKQIWMQCWKYLHTLVYITLSFMGASLNS